MGNSAGKGAAKATVGRPKATTVGRVSRQNVTGITGTAGRTKTVKTGRNKKGK
jgi:hypothetical protein